MVWCHGRPNKDQETFVSINSNLCPFGVTLQYGRGGLRNSVWLIERTSIDGSQVAKVVIRKSDGNLVRSDEIDANESIIEHLIMFHASNLGVGPKIYGFFTGGCIQEYIEGHTLTIGESLDKDIAVSLAQLHASDLPLPKPGLDFIQNLFDNYKFFDQNFRSRLSIEMFKEMKIDTKIIAEFPFEEEFKWLSETMALVNQRMAFLHHDGNYLNCLVREDPGPNQSKIAFVDYELSQYNHRGFDLGSHFVNIMVLVTSKDLLTGAAIVDRGEREKFIREYLAETEKLISDFDPNGLDSLANCTKESDLGILTYLLWMMVTILRVEMVYTPNLGQIMKIAVSYHDHYLEYKQEFKALYPGWP